MRKSKIQSYCTLFFLVFLFAFGKIEKNRMVIYLIGDSTVADYSLDSNYMTKKYPITGWGQVFQPFFLHDSLHNWKNVFVADSVFVDDRAKGGRSTRTFWEEGRWENVLKTLKTGDWVLIQFGHNDAAKDKPDRYVDINGYKDYLSKYVLQTRAKGAIPILITPVTRNYPWKNGRLVLGSTHGDYPGAMKSVADSLHVPLIDLTKISGERFSDIGQIYVTEHYYMNLPPNTYTAYPNGNKDNTHFQPEGAKAVAEIIVEAIKNLQIRNPKS